MEQQASLALDLFRAVLQVGVSSTEKNTVVSPISIATALAMTAAGAKGDTLAQITSVLKLPEGDQMHQFISHIRGTVLRNGDHSGGPSLSFANGLWVDKSLTLKPAFQSIVKEKYQGKVEAADFQGKADEERNAINSWVLDETRGKIKDLIPAGSLSSDTSLVLANALYFKGEWSNPFSGGENQEKSFHLLNGGTVTVTFLSTSLDRCITKHDSYKILKLPYARDGGEDQRAFSMYIVLPHDKDGLSDVEKNLNAHTLTKQFSQTNTEVEVGKFLLPKFKISAGFSVKESLELLGMNAPFAQNMADFSNMAYSSDMAPGNGLLRIGEVRHKAFVELNEEGTEAAAATFVEAVALCARFGGPPPIDFVADHPFLFVLQEDLTGTILFIGRVTDPSVSE